MLFKDDPACMARLRQAALPLLRAHALKWEDVEDVYPVPDFSMKHLTKTRKYGYNLHMAVEFVNGKTIDEVKTAFTKSLCGFGAFRTLALDFEGIRIFLQIHAGSGWWSNAIIKLGEENIPTSIDAGSIQDAISSISQADMSGLLFKIAIAESIRNGCVFAIVICNHAIFDAVSLSAWRQDLADALDNPPHSSNRTPYSVFANMYHKYRSSEVSQPSVQFFASKFSGAANLHESLWPKQRSAEWFIGDDTEWRNSDGQLGNPRDRRQADRADFQRGMDGIVVTVDLPYLPMMRKNHKLPPSIIMKGALALLNSLQTGQWAAIFGNTQASRQWPLVTPDVKRQGLSDPMTIAGSTHNNVSSIITVEPTATISELLHQISGLQYDLSRHAHVPNSKVMEALSVEDGAIYAEARRRQTFNWWPSGTTPTVCKIGSVNVIAAYRYYNFGVLWNCSQVDRCKVKIQAHYDCTQLAFGEMESYVSQLARIARWIHDPNNLARKISEFELSNSKL